MVFTSEAIIFNGFNASKPCLLLVFTVEMKASVKSGTWPADCGGSAVGGFVRVAATDVAKERT